MQKIIFILKCAVILTVILSGCGLKPITGEISHVNGDEAECKGNRFSLLKSAPVPLKGQSATFTPTVNRKKINAKIIKP